MPKLNVFLSWLKTNLGLVFLLCVYLGLTVPSLFSTNHVLYNLEPYPDGLVYSLVGRNLALGRGFHLEFNANIIESWVPPLYSLVLASGYLLNSYPTTFYSVNLLLGVITIIGLWLILKQTTTHFSSPVIGVGMYLAHLYILWLPSVPMSENLALPLIVWAIWGLVTPKPKLLPFIITVLAALGLFLTRYALAPVAGILLLLAYIRMWQFYPKEQLKNYSLKIGGLVVVSLVSLCLFKPTILSSFQDAFKQLSHDGLFYNFKFISVNSFTYLDILVGENTHFLWLSWPMISAASFFMSVAFTIQSLKKKASDNWLFSVISLIFFAQLPTLLIFYATDARYLILTITLISLAWGWGIDQVWSKKPRTKLLWSLTLAVALVSHMVTQVPLAKLIIADNILHRSRAWQHQATLALDHFVSAQPNAQIITALPPFLIEAYQTQAISLLPLSHSQEFLQKKEYIWGNDIQYNDLMASYDERLQAGQKLFITNAYITHQASVITDYEMYKARYNLTLVQTGCDQACNIYELMLK